MWSLKRGYVDKHPFDKRLDRMQGANDEKIISSYYLDDEQIKEITKGLLDENKFDIQDRLIWSIMLDSANRVGAIARLTLTSLDLDLMVFEGIREKRGKEVEVAFTESTKVIIESWLKTRKEELDGLEVDALLITRWLGEFRPMSKGTIQERVKKMGKIIGIDDFRSHCIRKTSLNNIYQTTGDLSLAAEMANHSSVETTRQSYIKPKSKAEIREKINKLREQKAKENNAE